MKDINIESADDELPTEKENTEVKDGEEDIKVKTEPEEKLAEESAAEDEVVQPTAVDTTLAAVACSIDGNVQFEDSQQISAGPISGKIKINITKPIAATSKDPQTEESEAVTPTLDENVIDDPNHIQTENSAESGEDRLGEEEVNSGEPPPPGVEQVQLKPRLVGRKLTELPPVMKGTELSGLCSIM